ncbi:S8 family serine peptidase [Actinophytocola gossypii]|uniref:S8 family serine peptidase n=1 Tax=Actinophytocola gossypii TaxID=2812003 RepID=A0ABT2JCD8_9PSEU|nr:S8 family serine peptidase [Actinophytocola gossypii]MCT2585527.1 S8 family serine peptidase [Actinophytocola gossypii]
MTVGTSRLLGVALTAIVGVGLIATPAQAAPAPPPAPSAPSAKVDRDLRAALDTGRQDFLVSFTARADLSAAAATDDWTARGEAVVDALDRTAERSQRAVRQRLDAAGVQYRAFHASNTIYVFDGTEQLAGTLAASTEVSSLYPARTYALPHPEPEPAPASAAGVEWGVADIGADDVWRDFEADGTGIVVANIDSGVQYDHPALVGSYRGSNGDGTFDHDYNWYDPAGVCSSSTPTPCDNSGHGTHTMGTMTGGGPGGGIGVAPGATWIAAKGCEADFCSSFALLASGEWLLAPTDADGRNPRPGLRPHIVNNSWGASNGPIVDPWYDDVVAAWLAAGIFPSFSNGNSGPGCDTAGTPGDAAATYSAGMYDADGVIAPGSSRGPGANGQVKPNISAPGVNVRSAYPGDAYAALTGTSMAAPHVSGTVALLWSAAPAVIGDIAETRQLLDTTAIDVGDTSCGGTPANNNVYGQGRLDAHRAVESAPRDVAAGRLTGTITDAATGDPVDGAEVAVGDRTLTTGQDGTYSLVLPAGDHTVTATRFGYRTGTAEVTVTRDGTTTGDLALTALPTVVVSGTVRAGSAHGWPLAATVEVEDVPGGTVHTDPETGRYTIELPADAEYALTTSATYPGYTPHTERLTVAGDDVTRDVELPADRYTCTAPGYRAGETDVALTQTFDEPAVPAGWSVVDDAGTGEVWRFDDHRNFGNRTGGDGLYGWVFSSGFGQDGRQDTSLVSPPVDLSAAELPAVWFDNDFSTSGRATAYVDVSTDGGATWTTAWQRRDTDLRRQPVMVPLPTAAGAADTRVRFRYAGGFDGWWQVDTVRVGDRVCEVVPGGLVTGHVRDANTGEPLAGATVRHPGGTVTTAEDGSYWLFTGPGEGEVTATKERYHPHTERIAVTADAVTGADLAPRAGVVTVLDTEVEATTTLGGAATGRVTVRNDGTAPVRVDVTERHGDIQVAGESATLAATAPGAPVQRVRGRFSPEPTAVQRATAPTATTAPWTSVADYPIAVMDNAVGYHDGELYSAGGRSWSGVVRDAYVFDPETAGWTRIADAPRVRQAPAAGFIGGRFYLAGGWADGGAERFDVDVYDPHTDTWTSGPAAPVARAGAGNAVLGDRLYVVGGCGTGCGTQEVHRFDPADGTWTRLADYPEDAAWLSCGGIGTALYCTGGMADEEPSSRATYRYDPAGDRWSRLADLPIDLWGAGSAVADGRLLVSGGVTDNGRAITNQGFAYDPVTDTWSALPNAATALYRGGSGCGFYRIGGANASGTAAATAELLPGFTRCDDRDPVSWLSVRPGTTTLAPGESVTVTVSMSGAVAQPGRYTAAVQLRDDGPYDTHTVPVTLTVDPPRSWGVLTGTVTGVACDGTETPLPGATVRITEGGTGHTLRTDAHGTYRIWLDRRADIQLVVAKSGYLATVETARVRAGRTTVTDVALTQAACSPRRTA